MKLISCLRTMKELSTVAQAGTNDGDGRYGHTAFVFNNIIYTLGGADKAGGYVSNMLRYDIGKCSTAIAKYVDNVV